MAKDGRFHRNGPAVHFEKAPACRGYPKPKKGDKIKCLACKNGKVLGPDGKPKNCDGCKGKGEIRV
jgi:hypothetical protein